MKERSMLKSMMLVALGVVIGNGINIVSPSAAEDETKATAEAAMPAPPSGPYQPLQKNAPLYPPVTQSSPPWVQRSSLASPQVAQEPGWSKPAQKQAGQPGARRLEWPAAPQHPGKRAKAPQRPEWAKQPHGPDWGKRAEAPQRPEWARQSQGPDWGKRAEAPQRPEWARQPQRPNWGQRPEAPQRPERARQQQGPDWGRRSEARQRPAWKRPQRPDWAKRAEAPQRPKWARQQQGPDWGRRSEARQRPAWKRPQRPDWAKRAEAPQRPEWAERPRGQWLTPPAPPARPYGYGYPQASPYGAPWAYSPTPTRIQPGQ